MSAPSTRHVQLDPGPVVQVHGDVVMLRGKAAFETYRMVTDAIRLGQRDCIPPSPLLLQIVAGLKTAASQGLSATTEIADLRRPSTPARLRGGEVIGVEEVAQMLKVSSRHVRYLAPSLSGWHTAGRGKPWAFDRALVQAYIKNRESQQ